jgi:arylsulfatase A-like enzyme
MRLKDHILTSSVLLATAALLWGIAEIITIASAYEFEGISPFAYLSILLFPLLLNTVTGFLVGIAIALLCYLAYFHRSSDRSIRAVTTFYSVLYFTPLLVGTGIIWNRRFLPGIQITKPISLIHSLIIVLVIVTLAYLARYLSIRIIRRGSTLLRWLGIGFLLVAGISYLGMDRFSPQGIDTDAPPATSEYPNVLLITIDTLRADHVGCYGNDSIRTPAIDAIAAGGALFRRTTSSVPLTLPSHASILTSSYPPIHGVRDNARYRFEQSIPTLTEILKNEGYVTAAFISAFVLDSRFGLDRGFDFYDDHIQNQAYFFFFSASPPFTMAAACKMLGLAPPYKPERKADRTTDAAIAWVEKNRDKRFFMWIHYFDPHGPLNPPPPYDTLYLDPDVDRREFVDNIERYITLQGQFDSSGLSAGEIDAIRTLYRGEVAYTDHHIGRLLTAMKDHGTDNRTLIVLTADHGQSLSEHDYIGHSTELFGEIMSVPLIIHYPPSIPSGIEVAHHVRSIDIMPTILDLLDIDIPETSQGRSLVPLVGGPRADDIDPMVYLETLHPVKKKTRLFGIVSGDHKYIRSIEGDREELYQITTDPGEMNNLAETQTALRDSMRVELLTLMEEMEAHASSRERPLDRETTEAMKALGYIQ